MKFEDESEIEGLFERETESDVVMGDSEDENA